MMDAAPGSPRRPSFVRVTDGTGNPMGLHRPGWRIPAQDARDRGVTDAGQHAIAVARQRYQDELTSAWRRGAGKEEVVPDAPKASGNDAMPVDDIETAYRLYAEEISEAWKTSR
jgi:hypothetical protein